MCITIPLPQQGRESGIPEQDARAIMVSIRHTSTSCAESPYVTLNIDFSGPCDLSCPNCHSKALWEEKPEDARTLGDIMDYAVKLIESGITNGICILGTDGKSKAESAKILIELATKMGVPSIVFTGHTISAAVDMYGLADFYVCGPYKKGQWHDGKKFYTLLEGPGNTYSYAEISRQHYFDSTQEAKG